MYKPGNLDVSWFADGQEHNLKSYRELSSLISKLCDKFYNKCPVIKNELINRNKLTGAAAMARRKLMAAMLNAEDEENLGFEGTGPEVAIYRTMLNETRLHFKDSNDQWSFVAPKNQHAESFKGVWDKFEEIFHSIEEESISVSDIINEFTRPPFGMKMGPIPVLICYYLAVKSEELALYYHGSFVPILGSEEMEMMTKRPEFFNLRRFAPTGVRKSVFRFYRRILNTQSISGDAKLRNVSMVGVVGPMVQFANSLTPYTRQTCTIGKYAQNVRNTLLRSKEPIQLLFVDLPNAVGLEPFDKDSATDSKNETLFESRLQDAFKELINADDMLLKEIQENMMNAFENNNDPGSFRAEITKDAIQFHTPCRDIELKSVLTAMSKTEVTHDEWFSSIASAVMTRPVKAWRDSDMDEFPVAIRDIADRFKAFSALVKSQIGFSESKGKNVRLVSFIQPDGQQFKKIIEVDKKISKKAEHLLSEIKKNHKTNEIEALLLLLSEELIKSENG
ncbi:hypothetical protein D1AOALGA4SA_5794 [Olavius algarvensis Delta 1 endosymbiont]|nr:hypothetical protein D1AOALGA4SA_5794 [Olavius algarvensis Delta 1 endosymbiont]